MSALSLTMVSPFPLYLDEAAGADSLAPRPTTIEGKVIGLLPNWRPSAFDLLKAVGALIEERYHPRAIVMAQPLREVPVGKGKLLDGMSAQLDDLARRVDVVVTATGD